MPDRKDPTKGGRVSGPASPQKDEAKRRHSRRTAGTNRDFDETGESDNQAHGHPRGERDAERRD